MIFKPGTLGIKTPLVEFFLGVLLLATGRRLYWLFIGVVGFIFGFDLARWLLPHQPRGTAVAVGLVFGLAGAILAVFLQKVAIAAAGFLAGGHLLPQVMRAFGMATHQNHWVLFIAGGIAGALLMSLAFGLALIVLSSLAGADLILHALRTGGRWRSILFVLFSAAGVLLQSGLIRPGRSGSRSRR